MQWCVSFPQQDSLLILRASLKRACGGNKAAAAFLSYLLYQVSISQQYTRNAEQINKRKLARGEAADQLVTINIYRSQKDIVQEMDGHLCDRTLRDTAIPLLVGLGYIEVDETEAINVYQVHLDAVQAGIDHPPTPASVGQRLRQLAGSGSFSARYQKAFQSLAEVFPLADGKTSAANGRISAPDRKTSVANGKTSAPLQGSQSASPAVASTNAAMPKKRKRKEENPEAEAEAALEARIFQESQEQAAAAGFFVDALLSSGHEEPTAEQIPASEPAEQERTQPPSASVTDLSTHVPSDKQQEPGLALPEASESSPTPGSPPAEQPITTPLSSTKAKDEMLLPEALVALVERILGTPYDATARACQLEAARTLLAMKLVADLSMLERVYAACYDDWWRQHYGKMHLTHLVEREKSGQPRIVRLLTRLTPVSPSAPSSASQLRSRTATASQSREDVPDSWARQREQASLEKLLRNGDQLVAELRASSDREAERFAAALQFLRQQHGQGGMPCNG